MGEIVVRLKGKILEKQASKFGNSSHVILPRKYFGKKVRVVFHFSEVIERTASGFGNSCHIILPKKYLGKKIKIVFGGKNE